MADEIPVAAPVAETPAAPAAVETAAPVVEAPVAAPVAEPAPAVTETPESAAPAATEPTSLLGEAAQPAPEPKADAKPEATEATPQGEAKADDGTAKPEGEAPAPEEAPAEAPLPTYDVFTVPDGVELEDPQVDKYVGILGAAEREVAKDPSKAHEVFQRIGQEFLDLYTDEVSQLSERVARVNAETFNRTMENWKSEFFSDPEIGGNRKDTTLKNCGAVIRRFGGTPSQQAEARQILSSTGAGNNRALIRLFNNFAEFLGEGSPVGAERPEPQAASRSERRYGQKR